MKKNIDQIIDNSLCLGCGLCESLYPKQLEVDLGNDGKFEVRRRKSAEEVSDAEFSSLCPVVKNDSYSDKFWGNYIKTFFGYSTDGEVRYAASSGGILTQTLIYLIEEKKVEAILHVGPCDDNTLKNEYKISTSRSDILKNVGSRYAPVKLLSDFANIMNSYEKIAVVGKPCDLLAVKNYLNKYSDQRKKIAYMFSFFCGGIPSQNATYKIIDTFGVRKEDVVRFYYRGNGWPGYTTAILKNGKKATMEYSKSWGKILGRDIHKSCKFCSDGLGEEADFSCGDGWYSTQNGYPDFDEKDGRNLILCRNSKGFQLLKEIQRKGLISLEEINDTEKTLKNIQIGQCFRKSTLFGKVMAMRLCGQYVSVPSFSQLWKWREDKNLLKQIKVSLGTIRRIMQKKL